MGERGERRDGEVFFYLRSSDTFRFHFAKLMQGFYYFVALPIDRVGFLKLITACTICNKMIQIKNLPKLPSCSFVRVHFLQRLMIRSQGFGGPTFRHPTRG